MRCRQGASSGNAAGFRLSSLLNLTEIRSNKPKMTLLHYVAWVSAILQRCIDSIIINTNIFIRFPTDLITPFQHFQCQSVPFARIIFRATSNAPVLFPRIKFSERLRVLYRMRLFCMLRPALTSPVDNVRGYFISTEPQFKSQNRPTHNSGREKRRKQTVELKRIIATTEEDLTWLVACRWFADAEDELQCINRGGFREQLREAIDKRVD